MNNKRMVLLGFFILICTVMLAGCRKPNFGVIVNRDNTAMIEAVRAQKGSSGGAGSLEVKEGQKIYVESKLNGKSEISLKFSASDLDIDADISELKEAVSGENAVLEITVKGSGNTEYDLAPGSYFMGAEVIEKADGTVQVSVR
jgi:hypothetical protein